MVANNQTSWEKVTSEQLRTYAKVFTIISLSFSHKTKSIFLPISIRTLPVIIVQ
jgi:hypothetical protein